MYFTSLQFNWLMASSSGQVDYVYEFQSFNIVKFGRKSVIFCIRIN